MMTLSPRDHAEQVAMLSEALEHHQEQGTLDSPVAQQVAALRAQLLAQRPADNVPDARPDDGVDRRHPRGGARAANQYGSSQVRYASEKQVNFIKRLLREVDITDLRVPANLDTINLTHARALIDQLLNRRDAGRVQPEARAAQPLATDKQQALLTRLLRERQTTNLANAAEINPATTTKRDASALIDHLMGQPRVVTHEQVELEAGIYQADDKIYKVYRAVHGSQKMVAKELVLHPEVNFTMQHGFDRDPDAAKWEYRGLASRFVKAEQKLTLEQAKAFGKIYGVCCCCGATLTNETSIEAGIGPVCASKF